MTHSLVENWQSTPAQSSKLVCFNSPCSPGRDAYSLDEGQDTLEEEDEEEGHEVERAISPMTIMKKKKGIQDEKTNTPRVALFLLQFCFLLQVANTL